MSGIAAALMVTMMILMMAGMAVLSLAWLARRTPAAARWLRVARAGWRPASPAAQPAGRADQEDLR